MRAKELVDQLNKKLSGVCGFESQPNGSWVGRCPVCFTYKDGPSFAIGQIVDEAIIKSLCCSDKDLLEQFTRVYGLSLENVLTAHQWHDRERARGHDSTDLQAKLSRVLALSTKDRWKLNKASQVLHESTDTLKRRTNREEKPIPLPWENLSAQFGGGLWPGAHIIVGGTGTGKSQWALQVALHAARAGVPSLYLALELGPVDLSARLLGLSSNLIWSKIFRGELESEKAIDDAQQKANLNDIPLYLESGNPHEFSYEHLSAMVKQLRAEHPQEKFPVLLVLDFLQLLGGNPKEELRERISKAAYEARRIAIEHKAAVLLLSSTGRNNYNAKDLIEAAGLHLEPKDNTPPYRIFNPDALVGLGKESGDIEFSADTVTALLRWPGTIEGHPKGEKSVLVATAKHRAGPAGWGELWFNGGRFVETKDRSMALSEAMRPKPRKKDEKPNGMRLDHDD